MKRTSLILITLFYLVKLSGLNLSIYNPGVSVLFSNLSKYLEKSSGYIPGNNGLPSKCTGSEETNGDFDPKESAELKVGVLEYDGVDPVTLHFNTIPESAGFSVCNIWPSSCCISTAISGKHVLLI